MKKVLIIPAFLILLFSVQSYATTYVYTTSDYNYSYKNNFEDVDVAYNDKTISSAGLYGLYYYHSDENSQPPFYQTVGFCVQPDVVRGTGYANFDHITIDSFKAAAWLMDTYLPFADTSFKKAGLQLAIWASLRLTDLVIQDNGEDSYDAYSTYMAGFNALSTDVFNNWSADGYRIVNFIDEGMQDMIVKNPVPEPATMALFGIGLLGIALVGRKRN